MERTVAQKKSETGRPSYPILMILKDKNKCYYGFNAIIQKANLRLRKL